MPPDHICTEKENIIEVRTTLRELVAEWKTEFRGVMKELKTALEDGREYRTRIQQNEDAVKHCEAVDVAQWQKIDEMGKRLNTIENWIASHGDIKEKEAKLDAVVEWVARQKGARNVLLYIPTAITAIIGLLVLWDRFHRVAT